MRAPFRNLLWPGVGAAAVHLAIGCAVLKHWYASVPALRTVFAISLVPAATIAAPRQAVTPRPDVAPAPDPAATAFDGEGAPPASRDLGPLRKTPVTATVPAPATATDAAAGPSDTVPAPVKPGVDAVSQAEHFYAASELSRLPALPGDPLIDLGDEAAGLDGTVELRLYIDEKGRVVSSRVENSEGLPSSVSDKLTSAFAGYPYIPGERDGRAVKSDVTLVIGVRDGQPVGAASR